MKYWYNFILLIILFSACSIKEEEDFQLLIPEENFISMMAEIHLAEAAYKLSNQTKGRDFPYELTYLYGAIYEKYQFDQPQLEKQLVELANHPQEMQDIYKKIEQKLKEIKTSFEEEMND